MEKYAARAVKQEIRKVLWSIWDPIGINRFPDSPRDEYDSYINPVFELLINGASDKMIAEYLFDTASVHMGLSGATREAMQLTIAALREIKIDS